jgi:DNA-binding response OmpR family regulator
MADILVVEDNRELAAAIRYNLEIEGFAVEVAEDGPSGLDSARRMEPDLLILDLMLPGLDGFDLLSRLRGSGFEAPVLILSARGEEADKVRGFRLGADQYLTKPFGLLELLERVKRLLARHGRVHGGTGEGVGRVLGFGDVRVDLDARLVTKAGHEVRVTPRAFDLLVALLRRPGKVASRFELLRDVWGFQRPVTSRTVDAHVAELRRKLEDDASDPAHIITVWGIGYRLDP